VVAFSGRDFSGSDKVAKYLNSPETEFFNKSAILYGMNFARDEARRRKYFILGEGQMDLIMSHKIGFENMVVTSGTSLTDEHLKIMGRYSKNIIFAFDADNAGVNAAFRGIKKALANDFDVKIIDMEKGKDPADTILESEEK
jgi:DNA primase